MKTNSTDRATHKNVDAMAAGAHEAVDWAADATNNASDRIGATSRELKASQEKWLGEARGYVQHNPAKSVGIALAGGYLIGRILRSR